MLSNELFYVYQLNISFLRLHYCIYDSIFDFQFLLNVLVYEDIILLKQEAFFFFEECVQLLKVFLVNLIGFSSSVSFYSKENFDCRDFQLLVKLREAIDRSFFFWKILKLLQIKINTLIVGENYFIFKETIFCGSN
jgi:hypothetical protein